MKKSKWMKLIGINLLTILLIILPFIPGPPNKIVIFLSAFIQLIGFFGLGLVPVGIVWMIMEVKRGKNLNIKYNLLPLYLITIPLIAFFTRITIVAPLSNYSRDVSIKRSEQLIAAIEDYKNIQGQYPKSIQELESRSNTKMPVPFIMGILNFRYNYINEHYSISFSQWLEYGSLEEIVLYDKNDIRNNLPDQYASYDYKFDLCRIQGAFDNRKTKYTDWQYFLID